MIDDQPQDPANRIAAALERMAPPAQPGSADDSPASAWHGGALTAIEDFRPVSIGLLTGIDAQRDAVLENGRRLAAGHAAHDILLWGARGTGKSALVKSSIAALQGGGATLKLVEASGDALASLPALFALLGKDACPTIVFIDDLGFDQNGDAARHLRSVLDGGAAARPRHVRLYVTSNRRHILPRNIEEQSSAINVRDVVDDQLALADRFGLSLGFHACNQDEYLAMIAGYARHLGLDFDPADALLWSTQRGARSGRVAWHYAVELAGRAGLAIS
jgi:predicted AAA+ superfamily ATPase